MSGATTISTSETKIEALKLQSSAYGGTLPLVYGVTRIPGNVVWFGGFRGIAHTTTESQGGKGGKIKTKNTTYTYSAAVMMGLCEGEVSGVAQVWRGKTRYTGGPTAAQVLTATQQFTVPPGGGSVTVANAASYSADLGVTASTGGGEDKNVPYRLAEGSDYTRVGGTYTFPGGPPQNFDQQPWMGPLVIEYQYLQAGAQQTSLQQLGLSLASGAVGQATWSHLSTNFPAQAIGYSGIAHVRAAAYDLGTDAQVENHNFEVQAQLAYSVSSALPDADPAQCCYDVLTNARYGSNFPAVRLGSTGAWSDYCRAAGLLMSPALTEQQTAATAVQEFTRLTNTAVVWSEGQLKFIPYGDAGITGNGRTYTPNVTPLYDLTDDHFIDKDNPVRLVRKPQADAYNHVQIEFLNRANEYNVEIAEAKDQANIEIFGLRAGPVLRAHWIADASVARTVAQLLLQRALYVRNTYEFKLPWAFVLLEPMDLVTLTDLTLALDKTAVRITEVSEAADGELSLVAEDFPIGSASATLYPSQVGAGFAHNFNLPPGPASAPVIFEAPGALTVNGLELYVAATGVGANWGGCNVWVSLDGTSYKQTGTINGGSRMGTLSAAAGSTGGLEVTLLKGALLSGSATDAAALNTLCYVGGAAPEFLAYETATLTGALAYTLGGAAMVRGAYGSAASAHSAGAVFVRVDDAVAKSGPVDLGYVGRTVHVKLTSFNVYGGGEEGLADVAEYTHVVAGAQVSGNAGAAALVVAEGAVQTDLSNAPAGIINSNLVPSIDAAAATANWNTVSGVPTAAGSNVLINYGVDSFAQGDAWAVKSADASATGGFRLQVWTGWSGRYRLNLPDGSHPVKGLIQGKRYKVFVRTVSTAGALATPIGIWNQTTAQQLWVTDIPFSLNDWSVQQLPDLIPSWNAGDEVYVFHGQGSGLPPFNNPNNFVAIDWLYFQPVNVEEGATVGATFGVNITGQASTGDIAVGAVTEIFTAFVAGPINLSNIA